MDNRTIDQSVQYPLNDDLPVIKDLPLIQAMAGRSHLF